MISVKIFLFSLSFTVSSSLQIVDEDTGEVELKFLATENYHKNNDQLKTLNEYLAELFTPNWQKHLINLNLGFDGKFKL